MNVSYFEAFGDFMFVYKPASVGACCVMYSLWAFVALVEAPNFFAHSFYPTGAGSGTREFFVFCFQSGVWVDGRVGFVFATFVIGIVATVDWVDNNVCCVCVVINAFAAA